MTKRNASKRISVIMACLFLIASMIIPAYADTGFGTDPVTLTGVLTGEGSELTGAQFKAYRIASIDSTPEFTVSPKFTGYGIDFSTIEDQGSWRTLAETLSAYIARDGIAPDYTAVSDAGSLLFGEVEPGCYLITAENFKVNGRTFSFDNCIVLAPMFEDEWVNASVFMPKFTSTQEPPPQPGTPGLEVIKIWKDDGVEGVTRPDSVEVELICDGQVVETAVLNKDNGWKASWELEEGKTYTVTEKVVPNGYTVGIAREGEICTVTNTAKPPETPPATPPGNTPPTPTIPSTGYHWMEPLILGGVGLVVFMIGALRRRSA